MSAFAEVAIQVASAAVHASRHHHLELAHVVAVREDADVAAEAHLHAGVERGLEAGALVAQPRRLGALPFFQPAYCAVASPAASVGQKPTFFSPISFQISCVPPSPCSMVSTPASIARRMPSAVGVGGDRPAAAFATSTIAASSSSVNVGRASPFGPQR